MNVELPQRPKGYKKRMLMYIIILILCVFAVGVAIYQFFANEKLGVRGENTTNNEIENIKSKFDTIFNNDINVDENTEDGKKDYKNIVYTIYNAQNEDSDNYDLNVNIPAINLNTSLAIKYNNEIKQRFEEPAKYIEQTQSRNIAYTVNYVAYIKENILSLAIFSTFKEGNNAQRTILKTYNYDLINNTEVSLKDLLQKNNIEESKAKSKIETEIKKAKEQAEQLRNMGYEVFSRNQNDDMYKIENTTEFFMYNNHIFLVYAYGNDYDTSEMDLVII